MRFINVDNGMAHGRPDPWEDPGISVRSLAAHETDRAFPLVSMALPETSLKEWRRYALTAGSASAEHPGGIRAAFDEADYIVGLFTWHLRPFVGKGRTLVVDHLIAVGLIRPVPILQALLADMEALRRRQICRHIHCSIPAIVEGTESRDPAVLVECMERAGFKQASMGLVKAAS